MCLTLSDELFVVASNAVHKKGTKNDQELGPKQVNVDKIHIL